MEEHESEAMRRVILYKDLVTQVQDLNQNVSDLCAKVIDVCHKTQITCVAVMATITELAKGDDHVS